MITKAVPVKRPVADLNVDFHWVKTSTRIGISLSIRGNNSIYLD
jgi:hypothetical protein